MTVCPKCWSELEGFSIHEGGWCPNCEEWFPFDLIKEELDTIEDDDPNWGDDLYEV